MIKLVLFDLDGVLIDAKEIHYVSLNEALGETYAINEQEHHSIYDGRKTRDKLEMLTKNKGLPRELHDEIFNKKQKITLKLLQTLRPIAEIKLLFQKLTEMGIEIGVCSNSIRKTVLTALAQIDLIQYCDIVLSNEDVKNPKPHPEIYWKAMSMMSRLPEETLIIEDSPPGLLSAERSRAKYIRVINPGEVTMDRVLQNLSSDAIKNKWKSDKLNVIIPMAGMGSRFAQAGYTFPKPLIQVRNKPMIQVVVENLGIEANYIFIAQKEHCEKYNIEAMLSLISPGCKVLQVDGLTEGAACTALIASELIDNENPLIFANSDQFVVWEPTDFMYRMQETRADGGILTFKSTHPKWSFAKVNDFGVVTEVAEKKPISDNATVGVYYWKHGKDFVKYANQMIAKNIRVNNEFYVCPVFNEAIADGLEVRTFEIEKMWGLGTPEDLDYFLSNYKTNEKQQ